MFQAGAKIKRAVLLPVAALCWAGLASAGVINIGDGATGSDPTGTNCPPCDPVLVGNGSDLSIEIQGSAVVNNQVLLALLIPNDTTDLFGAVNPLGTIKIYGNGVPGSSTGTGSSAFTGTGFGLGGGTATYLGNGFWGSFATPVSPNKTLSAFLDTNFSSSLSSSNFIAFDNSLGVLSLHNVPEFGVYTFAITTGALSTKKGNKPLIDIQIPGGLAQGSIAVALDDNNPPDSTVWTNAGGVNLPGGGGGGGGGRVPEPGSIILLGSCLAFTFAKLRKRLAR